MNWVRLAKIAALVPLAGIGWLYLRPYVESRPEQDRCSFGAVSNERYRELLAEAKRRQATDWPKLSGTWAEMNRNLTQRMEDMTRDLSSVEERIAAGHAMARAMGAEYRLANFDEVDPYIGSFGRFPPEVMLYRYILDVHRIGGFYPPQRFAVLNVIFHSHVPNKRNIHGWRTNTFRASILWPNVLDPAPIPLPSRHHPNCPPTPSVEWQQAYAAWLKTQP